MRRYPAFSVMRLPAKLRLQLRGIGHKFRGVAFTARALLEWNLLACRLLDGPDHLQDRLAMARSGVHRIGTAAIQQRIECQNVGAGQVAHVNIVANASAVRRVVVVAENRHRLAALDRLEQEWYQVRFRNVLLAQARARLGAASIEIPQRDTAQSAVLVERPKDHLNRRLRFAIRVDGRNRSVLRDRSRLGRPINSGRRGEDHSLDLRHLHRRQQRKRPGDVV